MRSISSACAPSNDMNYLKYFGLRELPFGITPDTSYFFACRSIQEALNTLLVAVSNGEGFIKITGEVGTGKTLLCRKFLSTLGAGWVSAYIPNPNLAPRMMVLALAEELGLTGEFIEPHRLEKELMQRLLDIARQGKRVVLCMDETQAMPLATLETVRLLTNLETEKRKLMQVVLFAAAGARSQARLGIGAAAAAAHHFPVHAEGARPTRGRRLCRAPADDRGLFRAGAFQRQRAQVDPRGEPWRAAAGQHPRAQVAAPRLWRGRAARRAQARARRHRGYALGAHALVVVEGGMSVINKMLQDLDRRQALGTGAEAGAVRASSAKSGGHEWFWRVLVVLLAVVLVWLGWVAIQLMPRKPLVTELAFQAAAEARSRSPATPAPAVSAPTPAPAVSAPAPAAAVSTPVPAAPAPVVSDALRLAVQLETPVPARAAEPKRAEPPRPPLAKPAPTPAAPVSAATGTVDKRDRSRTALDNAEAHFRRAALLLSHGRVSEAEEQLAAALRADPAHAAARQAYVALLLEQRRIGAAQRLLQEALALNPEQPTFALALARIHVGAREYGAALEVLDRAGPATGNADFQAMRGAVLQRVGRHGDAVEAYQDALRAGGAQPATTWIGLGISLESLGRRSEAAMAYRRALTVGPIAQEAREYAQDRARALE
jgi:Tfp pilus assembly protein PilF